ncbi:hypothetical protein BDQ12DRAFT_762693 [Crucibulum laeve]|uniref:Uncharacterized protein n=1 Tax=Crucibulum laeve TaxID=68775 RepID=A0A5C3M0W7_9AGAR|nr:hypothetical protein BDQ12DRAFT_762693 [Crucibulum laeve]
MWLFSSVTSSCLGFPVFTNVNLRIDLRFRVHSRAKNNILDLNVASESHRNETSNNLEVASLGFQTLKAKIKTMPRLHRPLALEFKSLGSLMPRKIHGVLGIYPRSGGLKIFIDYKRSQLMD